MSVQVHLCNVLLEKPQSLWCRKQNAIVHSSCCGGIVTWTTSSHAALSNHTLWRIMLGHWSVAHCACNHVQLPSLWQNSSPSSPPSFTYSLPSALFPLSLPLSPLLSSLSSCLSSLLTMQITGCTIDGGPLQPWANILPCVWAHGSWFGPVHQTVPTTRNERTHHKGTDSSRHHLLLQRAFACYYHPATILFPPPHTENPVWNPHTYWSTTSTIQLHCCHQLMWFNPHLLLSSSSSKVDTRWPQDIGSALGQNPEGNQRPYNTCRA